MMKTIQAEILIRSATAPDSSAAVMIANVNWNIAKARTGIWDPSAPVTSPMELSSPTSDTSPIRPAPESGPNTRE